MASEVSKNNKTKIFRDPVHGYISVNYEYCTRFIDNDILQRLRRVEQTSMRVLYPSAHHDRFAHSLGVFHLGRKAFDYIEENYRLTNHNRKIPHGELIKHSFLIACLLHDCAHSPFSHTFEKYYVNNENEKDREEKIKKRLIKLVSDTSFSNDFDNYSPSPHERISAIVVLEKFKRAINEIGGDANLVARMIIGCKYEKDCIENGFISLLNGFAIDVDKLDYIMRDTWASGVHNVRIDDERLLSSLSIKKDIDNKFQIFFKKHALSVINNVIEGRNFLYQWIYTHHKVIYEQYLIKKSVEKLNKILGKDKKMNFCQKFFSIEAFSSEISFKNFKFSLPCDGDLWYVLKYFRKDIPEVEELLSRKYLHRALWKTKAEFIHYFSEIDDAGKGKIKSKAEKIVNRILTSKRIKGNCVVIQDTEPKLTSIAKDALFFDLDGEHVSYSKIFPHSNKDEASIFFMVFVPERALKHRKEICNQLRTVK